MYQVHTMFSISMYLPDTNVVNGLHTSRISFNTRFLIILDSCYQARALKCLKVISVLLNVPEPIIF